MSTRNAGRPVGAASAASARKEASFQDLSSPTSSRGKGGRGRTAQSHAAVPETDAEAAQELLRTFGQYENCDEGEEEMEGIENGNSDPEEEEEDDQEEEQDEDALMQNGDDGIPFEEADETSVKKQKKTRKQRAPNSVKRKGKKAEAEDGDDGAPRPAKKSKKNNGAAADAEKGESGRDHKGLRHFSILVCEKLAALKTSTYKQIADQLVQVRHMGQEMCVAWCCELLSHVSSTRALDCLPGICGL
jgi:hypothetical protein